VVVAAVGVASAAGVLAAGVADSVAVQLAADSEEVVSEAAELVAWEEAALVVAGPLVGVWVVADLAEAV
jgi:hypothetical protein